MLKTAKSRFQLQTYGTVTLKYYGIMLPWVFEKSKLRDTESFTYFLVIEYCSDG